MTIQGKECSIGSTIVSHGDLPMQISMIKCSIWGYLDLTFLGMGVDGMQVPKDNCIIHGVFGIFDLLGCDVMCVCVIM